MFRTSDLAITTALERELELVAVTLSPLGLHSSSACSDFLATLMCSPGGLIQRNLAVSRASRSMAQSRVLDCEDLGVDVPRMVAVSGAKRPRRHRNKSHRHFLQMGRAAWLYACRPAPSAKALLFRLSPSVVHRARRGGP